MSGETKKRLLLSKWRGDQGLGCQDRAGSPPWIYELHDRTADLETALLDVRYWLHDGIVLHKLVSDPRALLRKIEDVL